MPIDLKDNLDTTETLMRGLEGTQGVLLSPSPSASTSSVVSPFYEKRLQQEQMEAAQTFPAYQPMQESQAAKQLKKEFNKRTQIIEGEDV